MKKFGFTCKQEAYIKELSASVRFWIHDKTGAEVLSFCLADENKVFGVTFRTPPKDSTGVAHILEHSVLCGSKKYPIKEPFVELLKGSLQTFLNAFTYPDKTCYPVASTNLADFYNLMSVYLDAVFYPRISKEIFEQEGWHYEAKDVNEPLSYKGVVYNEMKGVFSSPESVLDRYCLHALFPDTLYGLESGGDPEVIPSLTYADFIDFHKNYYHPSNARFFFWGDDLEDDRLIRLGEELEPFERRQVDSNVGLQRFFDSPKKLSVPFAASEKDKSMIVVNWLLSEGNDFEEVLSLKILEHILLGLPSSYLRRSLIESGLGEDLAGGGLETELRQLSFGVGLKGVKECDLQKVEALISDTLGNIVKNRILPKAIDAAINSIEFDLRENNTGRFPVGLSVMLRSLTTWLYDADPLKPLMFEKPLENIKTKVSSGEPYFESLIQKWFIDNNHKITVTLEPDVTLAAKKEEKEKATLSKAASGMTKEERIEIVKRTEQLLEWQSKPDSPEALATIPRLSVVDLPKQNASLGGVDLKTPVNCFYNGLPTGGIVYASAYFPLQNVPQHLLPLVPLFERALVEMGTKKRDFEALNIEIAAHTGGIGASSIISNRFNCSSPYSAFSLRGKASPDNIDSLFSLMQEVLLESVFDDKERFLSMVLEEKAQREHSLIPGGSGVVAKRLRARYSLASWLEEEIDGLESLPFLRKLAERVESDFSSVLDDLTTLKNIIIRSNGLQWCVTALPEQQNKVMGALESLTKAINKEPYANTASWSASNINSQGEAFILPAQVNYVAKSLNLYDLGYKWHGSALVALKYLRTGYLWEKVRVQGGAYGCVCNLDRTTGTFVLASYRDPNVLPTIDVYDGISGHLAGRDFSSSELEAAIVGAIGEIDSYMLPDAKGQTAFFRHILGDTEEKRQQMRDEVLSTKNSDFKVLADAISSLKDKGAICALGGSALEQAAKDKGWSIKHVKV